MSYEQYWDCSSYLVCDYRKAFRIRRKYENEMAWINGIYTFDAVIVSIQNALRKRGQKREMYLDRPLDIFPLTKIERKKREQEEIQKMQKQFESMRRTQLAQKRKEQKSKKGRR